MRIQSWLMRTVGLLRDGFRSFGLKHELTDTRGGVLNRTFLIGDTHFGHKKILEFEKAHRPFTSIEEHDEALIERWNSAVNKSDTVWHLGDVLFGKHSFAILPRLNGVKKLIMGNHDAYPSADYLQSFNQLCGAVKLRDCILTHIPVHPSQFYRFKANIHGHMHSAQLDDDRYFCVSAEHNDLTPILFDVVMTKIDARLKSGISQASMKAK